MSHTLTWRCWKCKLVKSSIEGAKFFQVGRYKRRYCIDCVAARAKRIKEREENEKLVHSE